jgi:hypothetical protein
MLGGCVWVWRGLFGNERSLDSVVRGCARVLVEKLERATSRPNRTRTQKGGGVDSRKVRGAGARPIGVTDSPRSDARNKTFVFAPPLVLLHY